ncbi:hypothetical protein B0T14DRAFT_420594 [Immersiella caudata]|uniref:Uncharacterized protein n=1 Tax=Immersiella caudata TaxID=314043 RepID=A0AA39XHJ4_9PEZI|nr:hypothetical protein B0T14DRAFT_420594 [Immersiella caudata]
MAHSPFPLKVPGSEEFQALCSALWDWHVCVGCAAGLQSCHVTPPCIWRQRSHKLKGLFTYYETITSSYVPDSLFTIAPSLTNHDSVLEIVKLIHAEPTASRSSVTSTIGHAESLVEDKDGAFDVAARIALMVNCARDGTAGGGLLELGTRPVAWDATMSRIDFMRAAFPQTVHPVLDESDRSPRSQHIFNGLRATRLRRVARLRFRTTNDLHSHLRLDHKAGTVDIYHHTAVLKEHLIFSAKSKNSDALIPRQLALEVIDSIQKVLFPSDIQSQSLLRSLVRKQGFDDDCLRYESSSYRLAGESEISYSYFGARLMDLYEEVNHPTPRGVLEKWLEPRSGGRHVMMATLTGVFFAIVLGIVGLGVQIWQACMTYEQLKLSSPGRK